MSGSLPALSKRLTRVERILTEFATRPDPDIYGRCNCRQSTIADAGKPEEFEAEMNRGCPLHECRRLGAIVKIEHIGQAEGKSAKLDQLLKTYRARLCPMDLRLSRLREVGLELKRRSEEP
jgi:hypothetical protein